MAKKIQKSQPSNSRRKLNKKNKDFQGLMKREKQAN